VTSDVNQANRRGIDWTLGGPGAGADSALEHFWSKRQWDFSTFITLALGVLAIAIPFFVIYRGYFGLMDLRMERSVMVFLLLCYIFLRYPSGKRKWSDRFSWSFPIDLLLIILVIATEIYTIWDSEVFSTESSTVQIFGSTVRLDHIVGLILVCLVLEATRRSFGWIMVVLCLFFISYSLTANFFPGPLKGASTSWTYMVYSLYVIDEGVYGVGASVLLSMIFIYLLFGSLLVGTRLGAFFTAASNSLVGQYSGGPAKVAIFSSAFVGSISGSASANVATTGAVTIPMMKQIGYKPVFAGAVETCASAGGYFTPPIMGAAAFLIASFTNTPYLLVCLYCMLPALLYFLAIFVQVHLRAKKEGLAGLPKNMLPSLSRVMLEGGHLIVPLIVVVIGLVLGFSVTMVAIWGIIAIVLLSFVRKETRQNPRQLLLLFERGTITSVGISMCIISVGLIQGALMASGLGMRLSFAVEALCAGNMIFGLLLAAVVTMILGMGVNPMLVYYIAYIFIIPPLVEVGAPEMPMHIFALMYGAVANITPPVCVAAYTAAAIAGAPTMRTGFAAARLGFACYLVPFMLVLHPDLLFLEGVTIGAVLSIVTATAGIICMAVASEGWLLRKASVLQRIIVFVSGVCLVAPQLYLAVIGAGLFILVLLWQKLRPEKVTVE